MPLLFSAPPATRLRQLLVLLLLALGLLAGMSVSQSRGVENQAIHTETVLLPGLQQLHSLAVQVDEQRGMAALHITLRSDADRQALEGRLLASRLHLERRMATFGQRLRHDSDRRHHATVQAGLRNFWDAQDKLLDASRLAARDPAAVALARSLLAGEAQQTYVRLHADIEAWWADSAQAAGLAASLARAAAQQTAMVVWALALIAALALAVAWTLLRLPLQAAPTSSLRKLADPTNLSDPFDPFDPFDPSDRQSAASAPGKLADAAAAAQQHLAALNEAVATARRGQPGRAAGLSAQEAQRLAEQVDGAAQGLRRLMGRPAAAAARHAAVPADPPDSAPPPR